MKLCAWAYTGSHSLFAEALHSLADVTNQLILAYGIHKSRQEADMTHPYGYTTMRYVASLVSGAMIFCVGAGLSFQHGISGLFNPTEVRFDDIVITNKTWKFYFPDGSSILGILFIIYVSRDGRRHFIHGCRCDQERSES